MRLLITTQAVDLDDPVLAFFHRWIELLSTHFEQVHVICLKKGRHVLPANVHVYSLGKEDGESRFKYIRLFLKYAWNLRGNYDTVFVHMNPEYLVLAGWLWRMLRKPTTLWYIHPHSSWRLWIARFWVNMIVSATKNSFPVRSRKLIAVGHGVDIDFFSPELVTQEQTTLRIMQVARMAPVKRVECVVGAMAQLVNYDISFEFDYYGAALPCDREYAAAIQKLVPAAMPPSMWHWKGNTSQLEIRNAYRTHDVHINATDSGSFDKAVFESMACGCITVVSNSALSEVMPTELQFKEGDASSLADALARLVATSEQERTQLRKVMRSIAEEKYSLTSLISRVSKILST